MAINKTLQKRILLSIFGVLFGGFSVGFFKASEMGTDPFQTFVAGILNVANINFGTLYVIINAILLLLIFIINKKYIHIATFINLFLLGYVVDFSYSSILHLFPNASILLKLVFLIIGFIGLCFGSSLYITANLGVSTYDAIALHISNKYNFSFKYCRIVSDLICVGIGFVLSAPIGIGTVLTAFCMGPLIYIFNQKICSKILNQ